MPRKEGPCRKETFVFFRFVSIVQPILALVSFVLLFLFFFLKNMSCKLQVNGIAEKLFLFDPIKH